MNFTQVIGNTWVLEANELIPVYRVDDRRCILLDTGLGEEQEALEEGLAEHGLEPIGILCSHAHVDHCGCNRYFQKKYGIPVALTAPEAGMCSHILNLKCYCLVISPDMAEEEMTNLVHTPDVLIPSTDGPFEFCGVEFQILQTPGHSSGHICPITPDNVCYVADALLSKEMLESKLPYALAHKTALESRERLRDTGCAAYIMAHRGVCTREEIGDLVDRNNTLVETRATEVLDLVTRPMTMGQIFHDVCQQYRLLSKRPRRSLRFERNTRFFVEYLCDRGSMEMESVDGVVWYRKSGTPPRGE